LAKKKTTEKPQRQMTRRQLSQYQRQKRRQRFIFIGGIAVVAIIVVLIFVGWLTGEYLPLKETVISVGDNYHYSLGYYVDTIKFYAKNMGSGDIESVANTVVNQIENNAILFIGGNQLGITVDEDEVKEDLKTYGIEVNDASIDLLKAQILGEKIKEDYFAEQVPVSDNQVDFDAMLLDSKSQVAEVTERLQSSENFSVLAEEYSAHTITKSFQGEFGWHPREVAKMLVGSSIPLEFAFNAEAGELSGPLYDDTVSKRVGYWLLNVQDRQDEESAKVQGILLGSEEEALDIKEQLAVTDNITKLIEESSQHAASKSSGGDLGVVTPGTLSEAVENYIFDENTEIGVWSDPIRDDTQTTTGGYWLVEVLGKEADREITEEDRSRLISKAYNDWFTMLQGQWIAYINPANLTPDKIQWAIEKVRESLE
jgi:hypothetical protein